jgi:hypothetical protein
MLNTKLFQGNEYPLTVYNEQALVDVAFRFYTQDNCDGDKVDFDFPDYASSYFRIFNERIGRELKEFSLTQDGAYLIANVSASDMTFRSNGNYYYEIGYVRGVYEQTLRYGKLIVV